MSTGGQRKYVALGKLSQNKAGTGVPNGQDISDHEDTFLLEKTGCSYHTYPENWVVGEGVFLWKEESL